MAHLNNHTTASEIQKAMVHGSPQYYMDMFDQKGGHSLPFFEGVYTQRGRGFLADFMSGYVVPALKRAAPHLLQGVSKVISDVRKGQDLGSSVRKRGATTLKKAAASALTGRGKEQNKDIGETLRQLANMTGRIQKKTTKKKPKKKPKTTEFPLFC